MTCSVQVFLPLEGESAERWYNMRHERQGWMSASENQIVVYQPNETMRLDVRLENETVWLTQAQLCALFGVVKSNISYHLKNIFGTNELDYGATVQKIRTVRLESGRNVARESATTASSSLTARRFSGQEPLSRTPAASLSPRGCLCTLRVRLSPNLPSEMLAFRRRISKMGAEVIPGLLASIRKATSETREYGNGKVSRNEKKV